jgi:hypothetical protein
VEQTRGTGGARGTGGVRETRRTRGTFGSTVCKSDLHVRISFFEFRT